MDLVMRTCSINVIPEYDTTPDSLARLKDMMERELAFSYVLNACIPRKQIDYFELSNIPRRGAQIRAIADHEDAVVAGQILDIIDAGYGETWKVDTGSEEVYIQYDKIEFVV